MYELAHCGCDTPVLMSVIAERQGLSRKYLHTLLTSLKVAGLVRSVRGSGGGFMLASPPEEIRLSQVLRALEGPFSLVDCVTDGRTCELAGNCASQQVWTAVANALEDVLDGFTLADMVGLESRPAGRRIKRTTSRSTGARQRGGRSAGATAVGRRKRQVADE